MGDSILKNLAWWERLAILILGLGFLAVTLFLVAMICLVFVSALGWWAIPVILAFFAFVWAGVVMSPSGGTGIK